MKAITIRQPWASLILVGKKTVEYRTWSCRHRGALAIRAGLFVDRDECKRIGVDPAKLPRGRVLCIADMHDCVNLPRGLFGWKLRKVRKIRPVPARGLLGLWNWTVSRQSVKGWPIASIREIQLMGFTTSPICGQIRI
jgi:activating signal cointegrator 1